MRDSKNLGVDNVEVVIDFNGVATSSTINKAVLDDVLSISNDDGDGNTYFSSDRGGGHSTVEGDDTSVGGHSARSVDPLGVKNLSQNVVRSKALVLLFLTLAAAMSGIATYRFTSHSERSDFHSQVRSHKVGCTVRFCTYKPCSLTLALSLTLPILSSCQSWKITHLKLSKYHK